ncbi:helix-turn-helix domain-containing protein [Mucilaginibacter sp. CSA2-8R]|uniref:winged helix-turn-helix transcriptional regulator n=1 Tax=Mucilaginibacter sp. CSA2-8R TaxID=3141542 RepID=UPI00315CB94A
MKPILVDLPPFTECQKKIRAIDDTMDILSGKWKVSILARLCYQPMRYSALLKDVNGISGKVLSRELKELEINELIVREVSQSSPPAVTYHISEYGHTLGALTESIAAWGLQHRERIKRPVKK